MKKAEKAVRPVDSIESFKFFWQCWRTVGIIGDYNKYLRGVYDVVLTICITIAYPLHLIIGLFFNLTLAELCKNLAINVTCISCSVKHFFLRYRLKEIQNIQRMLSELDKRAVDMDERVYFQKVPRMHAKRVSNLFFRVFWGAFVAAVITAVLSVERRLLYPAWMPFDWKNSNLNYALALCYQLFGISLQVVQNIANDIYLPISLSVIGGHVRMLAMRVGKLGYNMEKTPAENSRELVLCIRDHKKLVEILHLIQGTVFYAHLVQILSSGFIICVTVVCLLFFVDDVFTYIYFSVYLVAMGIEIFCCCYYGSLLEHELADLPYAIFNSNWLEQTQKYRKNLIIFAELCLKEIKLTAGGFIGINLNAFFGVCKMAYSMFAVFLNIK